MPTTEQEKPATKPRQRNRKADQRNPKGGQKTQVLPAETLPDALLAEGLTPDPVTTTIEEATIEAAPVAVVAEQASETALSGEVLPPEPREPAPQMAGPFAIAQAYGEYTRKSWLAGRFLAERLIAVRTFDQAIEVQGEFARFAFANFLTQSQKISELYGALALGFLRPFENFTPQWPRVGR